MGKEMGYLDLQAAVGITKHIGGFDATRTLLSLCHIETAQEVLEVGCGIGVGSAYIAKAHGCRVVGVDISEKMLDWARRRAEREGVADRVTFQTADVLDLPFEADRFDVVISESVLAFVKDKHQAIEECRRVTKPGGYIGVNDSLWLEEPDSETVNAAQALGTEILTAEAWRKLWDTTGLEDRVVQIHQVAVLEDVKGRFEWVGCSGALRAWGRFLWLYVTKPESRQFVKSIIKTPPEVFVRMGYGLFVGRVG